MDQLLSDLSPSQKQIVQHTKGPCLVLAGAGSGKTKTLTHRIGYLCYQENVHLSRILAVTFTNKAAREMRERVFHLFDGCGISTPAYADIHISTFHRFGIYVLRKFIDWIPHRELSFQILDSDDQKKLLKQLLEDFKIDDEKFDVRYVSWCIRLVKQSTLKAEKVWDGFYNVDLLLQVYQEYENRLARANYFDFDDLIYHPFCLLKDNREIRTYFQEKFLHVLVDEYQDTNEIQYELMKLVVGSHRNYCVVGDEDQCIYSWRGSRIQNILNFERDYEGAKVFRLEQNYRSTRTIVEAASQIISKNTLRLGKRIFSEATVGDPIEVLYAPDDRSEARWVTQKILHLRSDEHFDFNEIAVLYRTNAQSRIFEDEFRGKKIPYVIYGGFSFFERQEIKDVIAYLKLLVNPRDDISFQRILNVPGRGIGKTTLEKISAYGLQNRVSLWDALEALLQQNSFNTKTTDRLRSFQDLITSLREMFKGSKNLSQSYSDVIHRSGYLSMLQLKSDEESKSRIKNLEELGNVIEQYQSESPTASLEEFIESITLQSSNPEAEKVDHQSAVKLMTIHSAKGLEFPAVFIVGLEENLFPQADVSSEEDLEEERRLMYVAVTRSKKRLFVSCSRTRHKWGNIIHSVPSRFLNDIPIEYRRDLNLFDSFAGRMSSSTAPRYLNMKSTSESYWHESDDQPIYLHDKSSLSNPIQPGTRVCHEKFGFGRVLSIDNTDLDPRVKIRFENGEIKLLLLSLANLEILR